MFSGKDWNCQACKKEIQTEVIRCIPCLKIFHPGCTQKHKVYNRDAEMVLCTGKKESIIRNKAKERTESTGSSSSVKNDKEEVDKSNGAISKEQKITATREKKKSEEKEATKVGEDSTVEESIGKILEIVRNIKDEGLSRIEIKKIIDEAIRTQIEQLKQEIQEIKNTLAGISNNCKINQKSGELQSYAEAATKPKKRENILIVKPKGNQESQATKKVMINKVNIKTLPVGISKLAKGNKGTIIIGCESEREVKQLKESVEATIGADFQAIVPKQKQPKIKIVGVDKEEMELSDESILETIKVQNELYEGREGYHMKILKRQTTDKLNEARNERYSEGTLIIETDPETHRKLIRKEKVNIGWRKCRVYDFISLLRCFKCWGFNHIAKYCKKDEVCQYCAGNHKGVECTAGEKKCVNCRDKIRRYNITNIRDDHEATDRDCPTYRKRMEEEIAKRSVDIDTE